MGRREEKMERQEHMIRGGNDVYYGPLTTNFLSEEAT